MRNFTLIRSCLVTTLCGLLCATALAQASTPEKKAATSSSASGSKSATQKSSTPKSSTQKSAAHKKHSRTTKSKGKSSKTRGQKTIESERAEQIQEALIRERYMKGEPSGKWDDATQAALRRFQADQGWQSKSVPDSRALIKLGLGPSHDHLLNPETAMTTSPAANANPHAKPSGPNPVAPPDPTPEATPHQK